MVNSILRREGEVIEVKELRGKYGVFADRRDAGMRLAALLAPEYQDCPDCLVLAIPSGGVPVGIAVAETLHLPLELMLVRKIQIPGNTEAGYGAVTMTGEVFFNEALLARLDLDAETKKRGVQTVREELDERNRVFRDGRPPPDLNRKTVILVDDGLASGFTMIAALAAARNGGAGQRIVAVPTAPWRSLAMVSPESDDGVYCANLHGEGPFAVASAYRNWYDLDKDEVVRLLHATHAMAHG